MIYVITVLDLHKHRRRAVGYTLDKDTAFSVLEGNQLDVHEEGWYPLACVELVQQGIHQVPEKRWFFRWDQEREGYVLMEGEPPGAENLVCFGLG